MNLESKITIFTDGSSRGNPGPGGFGAIVVFPNDNREIHDSRFMIQEVGGREAHTTNNRMELQAAIAALSFVSTLTPKPYTLLVYSDSSYVINGITKWVFGWQKNGWITATKKEVENRDLWERLAELTRNYAGQTRNKIEWKQVAGHVGVAGNERCDVIATEFADGKNPTLYQGSLAEYPIKGVLNLYDISYKKLETKKISRSHQKATAYSYVSLVDGTVLVHKTWAECEARVKGKKAKYKKVLSSEEEKDLVDLWRKN
ncbi:MAG: ribonuclease H [Patescibacteria group bacterium]